MKIQKEQHQKGKKKGKNDGIVFFGGETEQEYVTPFLVFFCSSEIVCAIFHFR